LKQYTNGIITIKNAERKAILRKENDLVKRYKRSPRSGVIIPNDSMPAHKMLLREHLELQIKAKDTKPGWTSNVAGLLKLNPAYDLQQLREIQTKNKA